MIGYRLLYLQNDKPRDKNKKELSKKEEKELREKVGFIRATKDALEKRKNDVTHCTGYRDINGIQNFHGLILNGDLMVEEEKEGVRSEKKQYPMEIVRELKEKNISIPIVALYDTIDEENAIKAMQLKGYDLLSIGKKEPQIRRKIADYFTRKRGALLDIGITGAGKLGTKLLDDLREQPFVNSLNVHSEHYRNDYSKLWIPAKAERAGLIKRGFQTIEEMCGETLELDLIYVTAGKYGETAPAAGMATQDRNIAFADTMKVLHPRLEEIKKAIEKNYFKGLVVVESGPQEIIMQYMIEKMGFPEEKVIGVSPDEFRAKFLLRDKIREVLINRIRAKHGKNNLEYDSNKSNLDTMLLDVGVKLEEIDNTTLSYLKGLNVEDISLNVTGGRSYLVPDFDHCTIKGEPLFSVCSELSNPAYQDELTDKATKYGWEMMKTVSKEGRFYVDSADECEKFAKDISRGIENPSGYALCWEPNYKMVQLVPVEIKRGENNDLSVKFDKKRKLELSQHSQDIFEKGLMKQKYASDEKINEYERSRTSQ